MDLIKKVFIIFVVILASCFYNEAKACHALPIVNPSVEYDIDAGTGDTLGIFVDGQSNQATCGCTNIYWMDIEVRCTGEPFDGAPFNPGFYGPLDTYPYFQSPQLNKSGCNLESYPTTNIPFTAMCPGIQYEVRVRENHNGDVGTWSTPMPFIVPGEIAELEGELLDNKDSLCIGDTVGVEFVVTAGCFNGLEYLLEESPTDPVTGDPTGAYTYVNDTSLTLDTPVVPTWYKMSVFGPCTNDTIIDSIFVFVAPVPDLVVADTFICYGEEIDLVSTVDSTGGYYTWNDDPFLNDSILYNISPDTNTVYNLKYNYLGCEVEEDATVTVYAQPITGFDFEDVCFGTDASFTDTTILQDINGDIISSWEWDFGDDNTSNQQNPNYNYDNEGVYTVKLITESDYGCIDSTQAQISVFPNPEVDFDPIDACIDFNNQFVDQSTISTDFTSNSLVEWEWDFGDGNTSEEQNTSYLYDNEGTYNVELTVTSNNGCTSSEVKPIIVHPTPDVSFNTEPIEGCAPLCYDLISTSTVSGGTGQIDQYKWIYSNGVTFTDTEDSIHSNCQQNFTVNPIVFGVTLEVTSDKGCVGTLEAPNLIEVYHNPIADFDYRGTADDGGADIFNTEVEFINESRYAHEYEWEIEDVGFFDDEEFTHDFDDEPREYRVDLMAITENGCKDSVYQIVDVKDVILFYVPNAFTPDGDVHNEKWQPVFTAGFEPLDFNLLIFNRWGEVVWESNDASIPWDGTYGTNSNKIVQDGTYIWKIEFKESMSDKRHTHTGQVTLIR